MAKKMIRSIDELVDALDGPVKVGEWLGIGKQAVSNWSMRGYIPPAWHLRLFIEVQRRELSVHPSVFGIRDERLFPFFRPAAVLARTAAAAR